MKILDLQPPTWTVRYRNARSGGGTCTAELPVHEARVAALPGVLDALVVTGDLQGRLDERLLGEALPEILAPHLIPERTGVLLTGDLYASARADQRGASGPVGEVWSAFASAFRWVSGVPGNHDEVAHPDLLDGEIVDRDGLTIAGLGGILGNPRRPHRRTPEAYVDALEQLLVYEPDVLVLHEPPLGGHGQRGQACVRDAVDGHVPLVLCGHAHWNEPLAELPAGTQVLNVDARVVILRRTIGEGR